MTYEELIEVFHLFRTEKRTRTELVAAIALWQRTEGGKAWRML